MQKSYKYNKNKVNSYKNHIKPKYDTELTIYFPTWIQTHPITNHNVRGIPSAEGLRPISANAVLWQTS